MTAHPQPPPESQLIRAGREARGLSMRQAARKAGMSPERWRQIETGVARVARGVDVPVTGAPAATIASMAAAAGVTSDQLRIAGRPDAAVVLAGLPQDNLDPVDQLFAITRELQKRIEELERGDDEDEDDGNGNSHAV